MSSLNELKKTFYCYICDASSQFSIDHKNKLITYAPNFCTSLIYVYREMIHFLNVEFIKYANNFLQYVECYETDSNVYDFPFTNFLKKYLRRIPFIERCLQSAIKTPEVAIKDCWFICNKYSL